MAELNGDIPREMKITMKLKFILAGAAAVAIVGSASIIA